jgi:formylglycine-generating enzyme required for sulfatase activity
VISAAGGTNVGSPLNSAEDAGDSAPMRYVIRLIGVVCFSLSVIQARPAQTEVELRPGQEFRDCPDVCPEMVVLPSGEFMMGSPPGEAERSTLEGPQRKVAIARPFAVGKYEVTFAEWDACVEDRGCNHRPGDEGWGRGRRPVINVSWPDAKEYVSWLSRRTGMTYRLLSEAEWEYAARAGTTTQYAFSDTIDRNQAHFGVGWRWGSVGFTVEVGSFRPNKFGLYDMHGNVWELVEDNWHRNYEGSPPTDGSVWEGGDSRTRPLRGGAWTSPEGHLRSAHRHTAPACADCRFRSIGFRVARTGF